MFQLHLGAVYNEKGEYGWSRNMKQMKEAFEEELQEIGTDYADFGFLHCVDEDKDFDELIKIDALDYLKELKESGKIRHIGFSSHTPSVANRVLDTGLIDMMMFSINPPWQAASALLYLFKYSSAIFFTLGLTCGIPSRQVE